LLPKPQNPFRILINQKLSALEQLGCPLFEYRAFQGKFKLSLFCFFVN